MITSIQIDGFKSFKDFKMEFTPLTVVAGSNASGKSNLFDALQLLSRLAEVDLKTAFGEQRGNALELFTQYGEANYADTMSFSVDMLVNRTVHDNWGGEAELKYTRLHYELRIQRRINEKGMEHLFVTYEALVNLKHDEDLWVKRNLPNDTLEHWRPKVGTGRRGKPYISTETDTGIIKISQDGHQGNPRSHIKNASQTVLSSVNSVEFPHVFATREEMRSWKFLQLNPADLREPTRIEPNTSDQITNTGKNLAAVLYRIQQEDPGALIEMSRTLNSFLPEFTDILVHDDRANKQFLIALRNEDGIELSSRVLSEGTLRFLALCILQYDNDHKSLLCFEEPENGIHPHRISSMIRLLRDLSVDFKDKDVLLRQVIVNTHSPLVIGAVLQQANQAREDKNLSGDVTVWLSRMTTVITDFKGTRVKMRASKISPVVNSLNYHPTLPISDIDSKLTLNDVREYLATGKFDDSLLTK